MKKAVRIEGALSIHHIWSYVLDLVSMLVSTIILYFVILYSVFGFTSFSYVQNQNEINETLSYYELDKEYGLPYQEYEEVVARFYFDEYSEELRNDYNNRYNTNYTIEHIYNVMVLRLTSNPTFEEYSNDYFQYYQNEDGTFDYDRVAFKKEGSGSNYERNMRDIFYNAYENLPDYLYYFNSSYNNLITLNQRYELISRLSGFLVSYIVFYIVLPFTNKNQLTLFERVFKVGRVNSKNGYLLPKYKTIFRGILYYIVPLFSVIFLSTYSFIILVLGYLLINVILIVFGKNNRDLVDRILRLDPCDIDQSLIFSNKNEEVEFEKNEEDKLTDKEFLDKLRSID